MVVALTWEPRELMIQDRRRRAHVAVAPQGGYYVICSERGEWTLGFTDSLEEIPYLSHEQTPFVRRRDAELVAMAWANRVSRPLFEHSYDADIETYKSEDGSWRAKWHCSCGVEVQGFENAGAAAISAREHWRTAIQNKLDELGETTPGPHGNGI
jgi:hypothetical protein